MSFEGNFSQYQTGARYETIVKKRPYAIAAVQTFAENAKSYGLPSCDLDVFEPTEESVGFRIMDRDTVSTLRDIYDNFLSQLQIYGEYATRDNSRVATDEQGPYIELRYKDIVI